MLTFVPVELWKMFYVYSNDTGDYFKCKKEGREVVDGEIQTACSNACSNGAWLLGMLTIKEVKLRN
jgi:hypothetical protein